jgi:hypothetical protein
MKSAGVNNDEQQQQHVLQRLKLKMTSRRATEHCKGPGRTLVTCNRRKEGIERNNYAEYPCLVHILNLIISNDRCSESQLSKVKQDIEVCSVLSVTFL